MSAPLRNGVFVGFKDTQGGQADSFWWLQNQSPLAMDPYQRMMYWLSQISSAAPFGIIQQQYKSYPYLPVIGPYGTVLQQAVIMVRSVLGADYVVFPAPVNAVVQPDGYTLNMSYGPLVHFIEEARAIIGDAAGNPFTSWGPGWIRQARAYNGA